MLGAVPESIVGCDRRRAGVSPRTSGARSSRRVTTLLAALRACAPIPLAPLGLARRWIPGQPLAGSSAFLYAALACACTGDPAEAICPEAGDGDLVVTELRGEQSGGDSWGQWIEVRNQTGNELDLYGMVVELTSIDGGTRLRMLVRRSLPIAPGEHIVLGTPPDDEMLPDHMHYGFGADFETESDGAEFPGAGGVTLTGCGVELDRVIFDGLPTMGTWSLDDAGTWCADTTPGTGTELGLPGTPGDANTPCP